MDDEESMKNTQIVDMSESLDADQSESMVGKLVAGKYKIQRRLARGGMGVVYVAEHVTLGREVVFKVLSYHLSDDSKAKSRFEREARGLSVLDHPNIVTVHDFGHEAGLTYIVMEYVPGENLSQRVRRKGRIPYDELLPIALQMIDALAAAHDKGIVHRDVKPSNVMITHKAGRDDFVKVLDFGLAKLATSSVDITKGNLVGTVSYLAPEVIKGADASPASDVYSLGVVFYYLLTGSKPFAASDDMSVLYQHVNVVPDSLHEIVPPAEAPPEFLDFIHLCMEKDPRKRPSSASEMRRILAESMSLPSISAFSIDSSNAIPRYRPPDSSAESIAPGRPKHETAPSGSDLRDSRPSLSGDYSRPSLMSRSQISMERRRKRRHKQLAVTVFATFSVGLAILVALGLGRDGKEAQQADAASAPAPAPKVGLFELHTTPPGVLAVNGKQVGETPTEVELAPGTHVLTVTQDGYQPWEEMIQIAAGEQRRVDVYLTKEGVEPTKPQTTKTEQPSEPPKVSAKTPRVRKTQKTTPGQTQPDEQAGTEPTKATEPEVETLAPKKPKGLLSVESKEKSLLPVE